MPLAVLKSKIHVILLMTFFCNVCVTRGQTIPSIYQFGDITLDFGGHYAQMQATVQEIKNECQQHLSQNLYDIKIVCDFLKQMLHEENMPEEYAYLALMGHHFLWKDTDAKDKDVFWKISPQLAEQLNLAVNDYVDERKHLLYSTKAMRQYLQQNNIFFRNWFINALVVLKGSYEEAKRIIQLAHPYSSEYANQKYYKVTDNIPRDLRVYLAWVIVLDELLQSTHNIPSKVKINVYSLKGRQGIKRVARNLEIAPKDLRNYNPWLLCDEGLRYKNYDILYREASGEAAHSPASPLDTPTDRDVFRAVDTSFITKIVAPYELQEGESQEEQGLAYPDYVVIREGMDIYDVVQQHDFVSVTEIRRLNKLKIDSPLMPGMRLWLRGLADPVIEIDDEGNTYHIVRPHETLEMIAHHYNINLELLQYWNNLNPQSKMPSRVLVRQTDKILYRGGVKRNILPKRLCKHRKRCWDKPSRMSHKHKNKTSARDITEGLNRTQTLQKYKSPLH